MTKHSIFTDLFDEHGNRWGHDSRVRFSRAKNVRGAIVFLHGFNGSAVDTWLQFPQLASSDPKTTDSDLYFFGYQSCTQQIPASAALFRGFLDALGNSPALRLVNPSELTSTQHRNAKFRYREITIVAHSLGAVVTRLALLEASAIAGSRTWLCQTRTVFFAPAHKGAPITGLVSATIEILGGTLGKLGDAVLCQCFPPLKALDVQSNFLKKLEERTLERIGLEPGPSDFLRAHVLHGTDDNIVDQERFADDHPATAADGLGHKQVCKPTSDRTEPLDFLLSNLP